MASAPAQAVLTARAESCKTAAALSSMQTRRRSTSRPSVACVLLLTLLCLISLPSSVLCQSISVALYNDDYCLDAGFISRGSLQPGVCTAWTADPTLYGPQLYAMASCDSSLNAYLSLYPNAACSGAPWLASMQPNGTCTGKANSGSVSVVICPGTTAVGPAQTFPPTAAGVSYSVLQQCNSGSCGLCGSFAMQFGLCLGQTDPLFGNFSTSRTCNGNSALVDAFFSDLQCNMMIAGSEYPSGLCGDFKLMPSSTSGCSAASSLPVQLTTDRMIGSHGYHDAACTNFHNVDISPEGKCVPFGGNGPVTSTRYTCDPTRTVATMVTWNSTLDCTGPFTVMTAQAGVCTNNIIFNCDEWPATANFSLNLCPQDGSNTCRYGCATFTGALGACLPKSSLGGAMSSATGYFRLFCGSSSSSNYRIDSYSDAACTTPVSSGFEPANSCVVNTDLSWLDGNYYRLTCPHGVGPSSQLSTSSYTYNFRVCDDSACSVDCKELYSYGTGGACTKPSVATGHDFQFTCNNGVISSNSYTTNDGSCSTLQSGGAYTWSNTCASFAQGSVTEFAMGSCNNGSTAPVTSVTGTGATARVQMWVGGLHADTQCLQTLDVDITVPLSTCSPVNYGTTAKSMMVDCYADGGYSVWAYADTKCGLDSKLQLYAFGLTGDGLSSSPRCVNSTTPYGTSASSYASMSAVNSQLKVSCNPSGAVLPQDQCTRSFPASAGSVVPAGNLASVASQSSFAAMQSGVAAAAPASQMIWYITSTGTYHRLTLNASTGAAQLDEVSLPFDYPDSGPTKQLYHFQFPSGSGSWNLTRVSTSDAGLTSTGTSQLLYTSLPVMDELRVALPVWSDQDDMFILHDVPDTSAVQMPTLLHVRLSTGVATPILNATWGWIDAPVFDRLRSTVYFLSQPENGGYRSATAITYAIDVSYFLTNGATGTPTPTPRPMMYNVTSGISLDSNCTYAYFQVYQADLPRSDSSAFSAFVSTQIARIRLDDLYAFVAQNGTLNVPAAQLGGSGSNLVETLFPYGGYVLAQMFPVQQTLWFDAIYSPNAGGWQIRAVDLTCSYTAQVPTVSNTTTVPPSTNTTTTPDNPKSFPTIIVVPAVVGGVVGTSIIAFIISLCTRARSVATQARAGEAEVLDSAAWVEMPASESRLHFLHPKVEQGTPMWVYLIKALDIPFFLLSLIPFLEFVYLFNPLSPLVAWYELNQQIECISIADQRWRIDPLVSRGTFWWRMTRMDLMSLFTLGLYTICGGASLHRWLDSLIQPGGADSSSNKDHDSKKQNKSSGVSVAVVPSPDDAVEEIHTDGTATLTSGAVPKIDSMKVTFFLAMESGDRLYRLWLLLLTVLTLGLHYPVGRISLLARQLRRVQIGKYRFRLRPGLDERRAWLKFFHLECFMCCCCGKQESADDVKEIRKLSYEQYIDRHITVLRQQ